jgi:hypothetical protein
MSRAEPTVTAATISKVEFGWAVVVNLSTGKKQRRVFTQQIEAETFYMQMFSRMG